MNMNGREDRDLQIKKDLQYLTRALTADNLDIGVMFSPERGIRSCTPPFESFALGGLFVRERLRRVRPPAE